ncbi:4150_t:CDS:2 [Ambispora gerdemannii]|uniref:4150_t:CDS:1 n=1 Tax=Ambispora gerdemannii TaxID=144530 RepID=A0A9N9BQM4_9GLOM|nr:4150_t:CDS:2 [Ambispora gerdemannii]
MATSLVDINFDNGSLLNNYSHFMKSPFTSISSTSFSSTSFSSTSFPTTNKPVSNEPYILNIESTAEYYVNQYKESYENYLELSKDVINKENNQVMLDRIPAKTKSDRWSKIKASLQEKAENRNLGRVGEKIRFRREVQEEQIWKKQHEVWTNSREYWIGEIIRQCEISENEGDPRGGETKKRQKMIKKLNKNWKKVEWENVRKTKYGEIDLNWYNMLSPQSQFNIDYESPKKVRLEFCRSLWRSSQVFRLIETNFGRWSYEQAYRITLERESFFKKCWSEVKNDPDITLLACAWEKEQQMGQENKDIQDSTLRKLIKYRAEHETPSKIKPELVQSIWRHVEMNKIRDNGGESISFKRAYELALRRENELKIKWLKVWNNPICVELCELWEREEELLKQATKEPSKKNTSQPLFSFKGSIETQNTQLSTTIAQDPEKDTIDEKQQELDLSFGLSKLFFKCTSNNN